jgi:hypothetical protein
MKLPPRCGAAAKCCQPFHHDIDRLPVYGDDAAAEHCGIGVGCAHDVEPIGEHRQTHGQLS